MNKNDTLRLSEYNNQTSPTLGPKSVSISLTNYCSLNCITCWQYSPLVKENIYDSKEHLELAMIEKLFHDLSILKTERVILTGGGDPLFHKDFYSICNFAKILNLKITLISNLSAIKDIDKFLKVGFDNILVNFSSYDIESYLNFHPNRKQEDYHKLISNLELISQTKTKLKLVSVIYNSNYKHIDKFLHIAKKLNASVQLKLMGNTSFSDELKINEQEIKHLIDNESKYKTIANELQLETNFDSFYSSLAEFQSNTKSSKSTECYMSHFYSRIKSNGDVHFCCGSDKFTYIDSLHKHSFLDIWNCNKYNESRNFFNSNKLDFCNLCGKYNLNYQLNELKLLGH